jgi:hypothetical protein
LGDGRFFIFIWFVIWNLSFTIPGGKFTRYFTLAEPLILITAATGFCFLIKRVSGKPFALVVQALALVAVIAFPLWNSLAVSPHIRLFTNSLAGGMSAAGTYFPHDEFYDAATREIVAGIAARARPAAVVACETPVLFEYYARKAGRDDINFVSLSDKSKVAELTAGDFVVAARGRRYFSNSAYIDYLARSSKPSAEIKIMDTAAAQVYQLDESTLAGIREIAK